MNIICPVFISVSGYGTIGHNLTPVNIKDGAKAAMLEPIEESLI